jgi:hypothetical protein
MFFYSARHDRTGGGLRLIHTPQKMPFHEIMRVALMGSHERMSARRA